MINIFTINKFKSFVYSLLSQITTSERRENTE